MAEAAVDSSALSVAIHKTIFATGNDDLRPVMSGVLFEIGGDCSNFVSLIPQAVFPLQPFDIKSDTR